MTDTKILTAADASSRLTRTLALAGGRKDDLLMQVVVNAPGWIGGTPCVGITGLHAGIDWDKQKMLLYPAQPLTVLTADDVAAIRQSVAKGQSWHAYQAWKKQQDRIKELEAEVAALKKAT